MAWGEYPVEYNPRVHGPFDPARYYGKPDTKFGQVKLGEIGAWLARRNKSPKAMTGLVSRAFWRWSHRWRFSKGAGLAAELQVIVGLMTAFYIMNYGKYRHHKFYKYHW